MIPILNEKFAVTDEVRDYLNELSRQEGFTGEVCLDDAERLIHSTDNSIYQVMPNAVIYPRTTQDVSQIMKLMNEEKYDAVKVSPRGAGTGTNGQALCESIIVDTSKYMTDILEINVDEQYAVVQPGVVLDQLNRELGKQGYFFAPMVSTSSRATLGGMASNDSSGIGSLIYGKTSNHLLDVEMILSDGTIYNSKSLNSDQLDGLKRKPGLVSDILSTVEKIVKDKRSKIVEVFPKLDRFMTGYNLFHALEENGNVNLNYIVSGSEGTLSLFTKLKIKILPKPKFEKVVVCKFKSFESGLRSASYMVKHLPTGIETIDGNIVSLARQDNIWTSVEGYFADEGDEEVMCVNYVQFTGHSQEEVAEKVDGLLKELQSRKGKPGELNSFIVAEKTEDLSALWSMRKKGVGLLGNKPGERRPQAFVEDTAVAPEVLADFIMDFCKILDSHGLDYGMFGHIDAGCLHVRPALDLKQSEDVKLMRTISDQIKDLAIQYKGVLWGEHGKGFRGEYLPDFFGEELYTELRRIKAAFDPKNKFNPGKFCTPFGSDEKVILIDEVKFRGDYDKQIPPSTKKDYEVALTCNGNGTCFNYNPEEVMCPSYRYSKSRLQSPKGRATLVREWLRQLSNAGYDPTEITRAKGKYSRSGAPQDFSHHVFDSMKECLSCKACSGQCPVKVDIPDLKAKFLNQYYSRYSRPKRDLLVKDTEKIHHRLSSIPWLYNIPVSLPGASSLLTLLTGMVDPPLLSSPSLKSRLSKTQAGNLENLKNLSDDAKKRSLVLVQDPLTSLYEAELVCDHVLFFKKIGIDVYVLPYLENGKAKHVKGFLPEFLEVAASTTKKLSEVAKIGVPLVTIEPAIALTYREEYRKYLGDVVDFEVLMVQEYFNRNKQFVDANQKLTSDKKITLFGHCGEKASTPVYAKLWQELFSHFGLELGIEKTGCCGMAGVYGHEKEHEKSSREIFDIHWNEKWETSQKNLVEPVVTGASCRSQVKRIKGAKPRHPITLLCELL